MLKQKFFFVKYYGNKKYYFRLLPHLQGAMWGFLVASRYIFTLIITLLDLRNTATTKETLDFKNSHLTSVGATSVILKAACAIARILFNIA